MYYHERARLVYLAHPRTASTATANTLQKIGFKKNGGDHHMRLWRYSPPRSSPALPNPLPNGSEIVTKANRDKWTAITVVRNPWDTAISWFYRRWRTNPTPAFDIASCRTALEYNHWVEMQMPPGRCRFWGLHSDDADVILRYETFESDLRDILARRGITLPPIQRQNVSRNRLHRPHSLYHTDDTRDFIAESFREEIERFAFEF